MLTNRTTPYEIQQALEEIVVLHCVIKFVKVVTQNISFVEFSDSDDLSFDGSLHIS
jgi:hypothetical protein